jgi:hypothetical protein
VLRASTAGDGTRAGLSGFAMLSLGMRRSTIMCAAKTATKSTTNASQVRMMNMADGGIAERLGRRQTAPIKRVAQGPHWLPTPLVLRQPGRMGDQC